MTLISTGNVRHSTSVEVAYRLAHNPPLRDADAAAIASWFQSPGGHGATFAALASGAAVHDHYLLIAITAELESGEHNADPHVAVELEALAAWAGRKAAEASVA